MFDPVTAFEALAHDTRLAILRLLIPAGPAGITAGEVSERVGQPPNALSFHLARLVQADLVIARRAGRQIYYAAHYQRLTTLVRFLVEDCCAQAPSGCLPGCPSLPSDHSASDAAPRDPDRPLSGGRSCDCNDLARRTS
jgi:ArsR family transcriptional regulator, arsenate/arsenite/antimonite-responsive transcriptional repressor